MVRWITGGTGYEEVQRFYKHHFIPGWPPDVAVTPISHTVGHVVGTEAAQRLRDPHSVPANLLMPRWAEREGMD